MEKKVTTFSVARVFLERAQDRSLFRIRAENLQGDTIILRIPANKLGDFRKLVDAFHDWQQRGWAQEGPEEVRYGGRLATEKKNPD